MTRINVVPVEELTDNFILAEYFELPRIYQLVGNHIKQGRKVEDIDIPSTYTMGTGHMRFFYDKLMYLYDRHNKLYHEGIKRKLDLRDDPNVDKIYLDHMINASSDWFKEYEPTPEAIQINRDRLQLRRRYDGGVYERRTVEG